MATANHCVVHCVGMPHVDPAYKWNNETAVYALLPEPNIPHDPNAIKVVRADQENRHLGYVAREFAPDVARILDEGQLLSVRYTAAQSNTYRRVLHLEYISPALVQERATVDRLTRELRSLLATSRELRFLLAAGEAPAFTPSPQKRKRKKRVSFADPPVTLTAYPLGEPKAVESPDRQHEHKAARGDVETMCDE